VPVTHEQKGGKLTPIDLIIIKIDKKAANNMASASSAKNLLTKPDLSLCSSVNSKPKIIS